MLTPFISPAFLHKCHSFLGDACLEARVIDPMLGDDCPEVVLFFGLVDRLGLPAYDGLELKASAICSFAR